MSLFKRSKTTAKGFDWAGLGWLFLFFWYFSGITQLLILLSDTSGFTGFRQAFVMRARCGWRPCCSSPPARACSRR